MRRRRVRNLVVVLAGLVVVVVLALAAVGWHYSNQLLDLTPPPKLTLHVKGATATSVTLDRTRDTARPGTYGLVWPGGRGIVADVTATTASTVTRRLVAGGPVPVGTLARLDTSVYDGNPRQTRGLPYRDVTYPGPLGAMPAWLIPGRGTTWVIAVHGRGASRNEPLRVLPALHVLGLPVLDITYRNDRGAPHSKDRLYHLGDTEWQDLAAAVRYARSQGARRVILYGWSMGGAIVEAFLDRSPEAGVVPAVVLDAPVLDWRATLDLQSRNRGLPGILTTAAEIVISRRIGIDWDRFDVADSPSRIRVPTLIFHGEADATVPIAPARKLAAAQPLVTLVAVPAADHTQSWNVAPTAYDARVSAFLRRFVAAAA